MAHVTVLVAHSRGLPPSAAERVAERFPQVSVVEVSAGNGPHAEVSGDVLLAPYDISAEALAGLSAGVQWVHVSSAGVDGFPLFALPSSTAVTCARGASARPIAEFVLAVILAMEKHLPEVWIDGPPQRRFGPLGDDLWASDTELDGKVLGIVGLGAIGARVAELGLAFGMDVVGTRRRPDLGAPSGVRVVRSPAEVWPEADHLVLCAALTPDSVRLFGRDAATACKPGVHVVNVGRGGLVDHDALVDALASGRVARASLDVVDPEPLPEDHPLYHNPSVRISPHVSGVNARAAGRHLEAFMSNLEAFLAGRPLPGLVDRVAGY